MKTETIANVVLVVVLVTAIVGMVYLFKAPGQATKYIYQAPEPVVSEKCCCESASGTQFTVTRDNYYNCENKCRWVGSYISDGACRA